MSERLVQLQKLHSADPADPFLTYGIALEHAKSGDADGAIQWLDKTIAIDGQYCYAWYQKAKMLCDKGDGAAARQLLIEGMAVASRAGDDHARAEMAELLESIGA